MCKEHVKTDSVSGTMLCSGNRRVYKTSSYLPRVTNHLCKAPWRIQGKIRLGPYPAGVHSVGLKTGPFVKHTVFSSLPLLYVIDNLARWSTLSIKHRCVLGTQGGIKTRFIQTWRNGAGWKKAVSSSRGETRPVEELQSAISGHKWGQFII
jgi:hypothetical protein